MPPKTSTSNGRRKCPETRQRHINRFEAEVMDWATMSVRPCPECGGTGYVDSSDSAEAQASGAEAA